MPRFMLDTDICIFVRSQRRPSLINRMMRLEVGEAVMSVVTYGELRVGAEKRPDRERQLEVLRSLAGLIRPQDLPTLAAEHYGDIRADLELRGEIIGANDLWIAAHARAAGLTLVTNNEREYRRVPGLAIENWAAEP